MKAPICEICLNSNILCKACQKKLDSCMLKESDIRISRLVNRVAKTLNVLKDVEIRRIIETENLAVIVCGPNEAPKFIGRDGVIARKLSRMIGKTLRVVEDTDDIKEFVQNILYPAPVIRVNVVYEPEREFFRIVVPKGYKLQINREDLSDLMLSAFGKEAEISKE